MIPARTRQRLLLPVPRFHQPDDVSCGPTCLAQVFAFYGKIQPVPEIRKAVPTNPDGGTLAVHLGNTALAMGYEAALYPMGTRVFDPSWWGLGRPELQERLTRRAEALAGIVPRLANECRSWGEFLQAGGIVRFTDLQPSLLVRVLDRGHPIICGLNATWLYREARIDPWTNQDDDIGGDTMGHFVVVAGYSGEGLHFHVRDPHPEAPFEGAGRYPLPAPRLINAVLLGDVTSDAVLLEIWPPFNPRETAPPKADISR